MNRIYRMLLGVIFGIVLVACLTLFLQANMVMAQTGPSQSEVISSALAYLQAQQQADGGMMGFSGISDPDTTARAVLAFVATGEHASDVVSSDGNSMLDYLANQTISFTHDLTGTLFPGRAGLLIAAVSLEGENPSDFGGIDLVGELEESFQPATGAYSTTAKQDFSSGQASDLNQAWTILGLSLAGREIPAGANQYLLQSQVPDGSWGFGDPDTTALAVTALLGSLQVDAQDQSIQNALKYFHDTQLENGGWRPSWDTDPLNADSTGWILQALVSAGEDPASQNWTGEQSNAIDALMSLQKPDGSIGGTYANTYSTAEAIIGLSGVSLSSLGTTPTSNRAGVAIFFGDGSVFTSCVSFSETSISGLDLLKGSGLTLETATNPSQGTAICKIDQTGCPANDCFCNMPNYWSYWQPNEDGWAYATIGAEQSQVENGDVNAWSWGDGTPPALISYQNICEGVKFVLPTATPTTLPPTDTPLPTQAASAAPATDTPQPTSTPSVSQTGPGTYIVYGSILIVLAALIVYMIRSRRKS